MASFHFGCTVVDTCRKMKSNGLSGGIYGVAFLGALVYYLQHATTFMMGLLGVIKALFWPAFLMYRILELLRM